MTRKAIEAAVGAFMLTAAVMTAGALLLCVALVVWL